MSETDPTPTLSELLNIPETFSFEGKEYSMRELTIEQRGRFGKWLRDRALAAACNPDAPPHVVARLEAAYLRDAAAGVYEFDSPVGIAAIQTPDGQAMALWLCLQADHPEVDIEVARQMVAAKWKEIGKLIEEKLADPKSSAAVKAALGLPTSSPSSAIRRSAGRSKKSKGSRRRK